MAERRLMGAAALFIASTAWGAGVSLREDVVGEPLGWRAPGKVATHLAIGWGSGLSAPWPMVAIVLADAVRGSGPERQAGQWCAVVGAALVAGVLVEPVTWGRRACSLLIASTVIANVSTGALLVLAGRRAAARVSG